MCQKYGLVQVCPINSYHLMSMFISWVWCVTMKYLVPDLFCLLFLVKSGRTDRQWWIWQPTMQFAQGAKKYTLKILDTKLTANLKWPRSTFYFIGPTHIISRWPTCQHTWIHLNQNRHFTVKATTGGRNANFNITSLPPLVALTIIVET